MGNCFRKTSSASIHPELPSRQALIKVRMTAIELEQLYGRATDDGEVGKLILEGCIQGRWEFRSVSALNRLQTILEE
ncbi:hypothetical protein FCM35_KLT11275 [Carex littledalei]|uniref:Uncharacterized protein n=1 Tax=Carex littledalei TaxID=544730 RepID=A0A833QTV4_9POAL|nr:hypothetical protein FCM35_KLT11275 [Carex littledalei]